MSKWEGSKADKKLDKREAKKRGLPMEKWEGSKADEKMDKVAKKKEEEKIMDSLRPKLIKPESTLIEKTALELACVFYEAGRSSGLTSRYKNPRDYAKRHIKEFIPKAVELLMEILANPATPVSQKDAIYDCFMERTNDTDLSNIGLKAFENPLAASFVSDKVIPQKPLVANSKRRIEDLPLSSMLHERIKTNG